MFASQICVDHQTKAICTILYHAANLFASVNRRNYEMYKHDQTMVTR